MKTGRRFALGLVAVVAVGIIVLTFARGRGVTALRAPGGLEAPAAKAAWRWLVPAAARAAVNPAPEDADALRGAREHWADHCSGCHANDGSGDTPIGRRTFPPPPDMRARTTQDLTDGELFYAIQNGVPWTAMPGWSTGTADGERESWALVRFIRKLPALTPDEIREMERFNPRSPADEQRDREIDDFLTGSDQGQTGVRPGSDHR